MEDKTYKVGEIIKITEDLNITTLMGNTKSLVKKGDKAIINKDGNLHILTGSSQQKILTEKLKVKGVDTTSIALMIFNQLKNEFNIDKAIESEGWENKDVVDCIWGVLDTIF